MRRRVPCSTRSCLLAKVGSGAATCSVALDPASLIRRASTLSRVLWLQTRGEGFGVPRVLRLRILPPYQEGSGAITRHVAPCGPHASNIKKSLAGLPVWLGTHIPNARMYVSKAPDVRAIIGL
jgi:hypothetical protein